MKNKFLLPALIVFALGLAGVMAYIIAMRLFTPKAVPVINEIDSKKAPSLKEEISTAVDGSENNDEKPLEIKKETAVVYDAANLPEFGDFSVDDIYSGTPAPMDFSGNPDAARFKTALANAAASGPNFSGHYTVASWGCGTSCKVVAIVDATTGKVNILPGINPWAKLDYRIDSSLLVVNDDPDLGREYAANMNAVTFNTDYYNWKEGRISLVYSRNYIEEVENGSFSSDPAEVAKTFYAWYFSCDSRIRSGCDYAKRPDLADNFKKRFDTYVNYDQLMCSQDPTHDVEFGPAKTSADTANIDMKQNYLGGTRTITIKLIKDGGRWKINDVVCPAAPEAKG